MKIGGAERRRAVLLVWVTVVLFVAFVIGHLQSTPPQYIVVYESAVKSEELKRLADEEQQVTEALKNGDRRKSDVQVLDYGVLSDDQLIGARDLDVPLESVKGLPWLEKPNVACEELPQFITPEEFIEHAKTSVAVCKELTSGLLPIVFPAGSDPRNWPREKLEQAIKAKMLPIWRQLRLWSEEHAHQSHLYTLGSPSVFDLHSKGAVAEGEYLVRVRLPASYTDLARMLLVYFNAPGERQPVRGINGSQPLTGGMLVTYELARKAVQLQREKASEAWETGSDGALTEYALAARLHDFVSRNCRYNVNMLWADNEMLVVNAMLGNQATSAGYARLYSLLLHMAGIENIYVRGVRRLESGGFCPYFWNMARLDGRWVHIDVAGSDRVELTVPGMYEKKIPLVSHVGFSLNDIQMRRSLGLKEEEWAQLMESNPEAADAVAAQEQKNVCYYAQKMISLKQNGKEVHRNLMFTDARELIEVLVARAMDGIFADEYQVPGLTAEKLQEASAGYQKRNEYLHLDIQMTSPDANEVRLIAVSFTDSK